MSQQGNNNNNLYPTPSPEELLEYLSREVELVNTKINQTNQQQQTSTNNNHTTNKTTNSANNNNNTSSHNNNNGGRPSATIPKPSLDFDSDSDEESLLGNNNRKSNSLLVKKYTYEFHQNRPCRDILFLIVFILFCIGMIAIALEAIVKRREYISAQLKEHNQGAEMNLLKASVADLLTSSVNSNNNNPSSLDDNISFFNYFIPSKREMTRFFYPIDYLGRACGVDYSKDDGSLDSLSIQNRALQFADSMVDKNYWKEDLSSRKYLWIMNEKDAFFGKEKYDLAKSTVPFETWIKHGGICVESCPSAVKTIDNSKNLNNKDLDVRDEFSSQSTESLSFVSDECPLSLRKTWFDKTEITEQVKKIVGNETITENVTKVIIKKKNLCAAKRFFLSKEKKAEPVYFEVPQDQTYFSVMGRCIPTPSSFAFFEQAANLAKLQNNLNTKSSLQTISGFEMTEEMFEQQKSALSNLIRHITTISPASYFSATIGPYIDNLPTISNIGKEINIQELSGLMPSFLEKFIIKSVTMLYNSWKIILISVTITAAVSFITVVLLRVLAKPLIYGTVALLILAWFSLSIMLLVEGGSDLHFNVSGSSRWSQKFSSTIADLTWENSLYLGSGLFLLFTNLLFTFIFWNYWKKTLSRSVSIIKESAMIITTVPQMFTVLPIAIFIGGIIFCVWWFCVVALLLTNELTAAGITDASSLAGKVTSNIATGNTLTEKMQSLSNPTSFILTLQSHLLKGWFAYYLLGFFWITQFLLSFVTIVVARVTSTFYFKFGNVSGTITAARRGESSSAIFDSYEKTLMCLKLPVLQASLFVMYYNAGSIALASLFVGLVKYLILVIKTSLSLMGYQSEKSTVEQAVESQFFIVRFINNFRNNFLTRFIHRILFVILKYIEKFMEFFARNSLIHCAIFGTTFFHSSLSSTKLMRKNITFIAVLEWITDWIMFCMKMLVAIISVAVAYIIIHAQDKSLEEFTSVVGKITNAYNEQGNYGLFEIVFSGKEWLDVNHSFMLLVIVFAMSVLVSSLFITIFQTVIDTVLQCYLIDLEMYRRSGRSSAGENGRISSTEMIQIMEQEKELNYQWLDDHETNM
ncbi:hypothetical protein NAEGRDRAFT_81644 [Naegleria gruberi]|uniref:Uncharacterized protein n=1 Tax=Naegleria gruberi TaxID=5762 RepID=D2VXV8_NAEGR|nr:uncharacterized protein NAEGRDRAFT_81644 [Naegleria gruberi]EFC38407.1 hypothetical protein NAEGRDRAFT_81644 [Naegleria gruberi]|eukprot:XP_002671151.1 hypothetical protein NAEGRDRAFT_81644 [Naegleria gruberi strain NEG-M]